MRQILFVLAISSGISFFSCSKSSSIGGDVVGINDYETKLSSDISIEARTIIPEATTGFIHENSAFGRHFLGHLTDPIFGESEAAITAQFLLVQGYYNTVFSDPIVDSVVLVLDYDTLASRGDFINAGMDIDVFRLTEELNNHADYETNSDFRYNPTPIGSLNDVKLSGDSVEIKVPVNGKYETEKYPAQLRIELDKSFGEELLSYDSIYYTVNERFLEKFKGLHITADVENTMLAFNLLNNTSRTAINVYYKEDTVPKLFRLFVSSGQSVALNTYHHEYSGSEVAAFINNQEKGDSLLFLQGMSGVEIEVALDGLSQFEDKVINYAELTMYYTDIGKDSTTTRDISAMTITRKKDDRDVLIIDAANAERTGSSSTVRKLFGGVPIQIDSTTKAVKFKIPLYFQEVIRGDYKPVFRIRPRAKAINAGNSIFYGPGHSDHPMKLKVIYTEIK